MTPLLEVFYDGGCPLCAREVAMLRRLDHRQALVFTDIDAPGFTPPPGRTMEELMASLHARMPDGAFIDGVEVFRQMYAAIRFGPFSLRPLVGLTRLPGLSHALTVGYRIFAQNRLRLTGRHLCDGEACRRAHPSPQAPASAP